MNVPLISIYITNYNYKNYLQKALYSAINQNFNKNDYEIILIDDCSTDGSREIIKKYVNKKNIRIIYNKKNIGLILAIGILLI